MKATYHPEADRSLVFDVIKQHEDGSVDLAFEGNLVVSNCKVASEVIIGACTIEIEEKKEKSTKTK